MTSWTLYQMRRYAEAIEKAQKALELDIDLPHAKLVELYRECDVFALPSIVMGSYGRQDVIPNVLAEAMAVGTPVVATAIAGIPELIDDEQNGLLVPQRDPVRLADALERLHREPATAARLGAAGRSKVERIWNREQNLDAR